MSDIALDLVTCPACQRAVPPGEFCGACGAHLLSETDVRGHQRRHAYAAHPGEHVIHLSVVSTLLPHLPHRRSTPFRVALVVATVVLVALGLARMTGPAVAAAALVVPVLYLLYLYEVEVYADEPVWVIGSTVMVGALLGVPWALYAGPRITGAVVENVGQGVPVSSLLVAGVVAPVAAQVLMLAGALVVFATRRFYDEALDGFTFGAAGALGFTFSTTLLNLLPDVQQGLFSATPPLVNALEVIQRGLLLPFLNASTTGLIAGALWLRRGEIRRHAGHHLFSSVVVAAVIAAVFQVLVASAGILLPSAVLDVAVSALAVGVLLLWVRLAIHHMLLSEAVEVEIGPDMVCTHCHRVVPRMAFCPHCGIATRATPKTGEGRQGRAVRKVG